MVEKTHGLGYISSLNETIVSTLLVVFGIHLALSRILVFVLACIWIKSLKHEYKDIYTKKKLHIQGYFSLIMLPEYINTQSDVRESEREGSVQMSD